MTRSVVVVAMVGMLARTARADDSYQCKEASPETKIEASFKPEVSMMDLAAWVTGFTCKNVIFSADVAKRATRVVIVAPKPMTPKQALQLFVDSVDATGLVVTVKADSIIVKLGPGMPKTCPDLAATPVKPTDPLAKRPDPDLDLRPSVDLDHAITVVDATHRTIKRDAVDSILGNPMALAGGARVVPAMNGGNVVGFKLYAIRPNSLLARLGFQNGDTLVSINGFALTSAEKALEIYTKIREATFLEFEVQRAGKTLRLDLSVN
jgi:type II secretory pathway component PulC